MSMINRETANILAAVGAVALIVGLQVALFFLKRHMRNTFKKDDHDQSR